MPAVPGLRIWPQALYHTVGESWRLNTVVPQSCAALFGAASRPAPRLQYLPALGVT